MLGPSIWSEIDPTLAGCLLAVLDGTPGSIGVLADRLEELAHPDADEFRERWLRPRARGAARCVDWSTHPPRLRLYPVPETDEALLQVTDLLPRRARRAYALDLCDHALRFWTASFPRDGRLRDVLARRRWEEPQDDSERPCREEDARIATEIELRMLELGFRSEATVAGCVRRVCEGTLPVAEALHDTRLAARLAALYGPGRKTRGWRALVRRGETGSGYEARWQHGHLRRQLLGTLTPADLEITA